MKKVVLLAPTPPPAGGIAGWTSRMMKVKLPNEWQVVVVDEKPVGKREVFGKNGRRHFLEEIHRSLSIWNRLRKALKDPESKVVHSCIPAYSLSMVREYICACITKLYKRKFIIHFRCTIPNIIMHSYEKYILRKLCNISDMVFSLNQQSSEFLCKLTKTPIRLIPNFISIDELVKERHINDDLKRMIYVGGIVENKGIMDIIDIAEQLPDIQFVLIGKGDTIFEEKTKSRGINNVIFHGEKAHEEVREDLMNADAFIFMTHFRGEGFSNSLCEAMATGLPCIVTDWAANKDMIESDGGIVVPVGDVTAAVLAIQSIRNKKIREKMSKRNINKVKSDYIETVVANQYVESYERIMS